MSKQTRNVRVNVTSNVGTQMNKGTVAAGGLGTALKGVGTSASLATGGIRAMTAALISSGVGAVVVAVGSLIAGLSTLVTKSSEFDKSFSKLAAITGKSKEEIEGLKIQAKELGATTAFTASQVLELQTELAKLGFSVGQIDEATPSILDLSAALGTELGEAAEFAGSVVRSFGLETKDTQRIVDVMAKSATASAQNFETLKESFKLVAPSARALGVSVEETGALLGAMANNGLKGSIAGTGLQKVFIELAKKGMTLEEGLAKVAGSSDKLNTALDLVGTIGSKSLLTLVNAGDDISYLRKELNDSAGAAERLAQVQLDNLSGDTTKLASAWEGFILSLEDGSGMLSKLTRGFVQMTTSILGFFTAQTKQSDAMQTMQTDFSMAASSLSEYQRKVDDTTYSEEERNSAAQSRDRLFDKMKKDFPKLLGNLNIEKDGFVMVASAIKKVNDELVNKIVLQKKDEAIEEKMQKVADKRLKILELEEEQRRIIAQVQNDFDLDTTMTQNETIQWLKDTNNLTTKWGSSTLGGYGKLGAKLLILRESEEGYAKDLNILSEKRNELAKAYGITLTENKEIADTTTGPTGPSGPSESDEEKQKRETAEALALERKKAFLDKLDRLEADYDADTNLKKIELKRERHLTELDQLVMDETEKRQAKKDINDYYDGLEADQIAENKKVADAKKVSDEEKADAERIALAEKEEAARQAKIQGMYDVLDSAADVAGRESKIGKALLAIKMAMQLKELVMKMQTEAQKLMVVNTAAAQETAVAGAKVGVNLAEGASSSSKVGFPWNIVTIASYALQAASMIKAFKGAKGKMDSVTGMSSGSGGGMTAAAPQAPSFNVLGATSAGDNMLADVIGQSNNSPVRAYVVESEVASAQSLSRNANDIASID